MATEAAEVDALHQGQPDHQFDANPAPDSGADGQKLPVKRSWRRKYRKMRAKFEETMNASNQLILDEWKAQALARRLQEQNDQILDVLLQLNDQVRIPAPLRYDLRTLAETDPALPTGLDPEPIQERLHELRALLADGTITAEDYAQRADQLHTSHQIGPMLGLSQLEADVPHSTNSPDPPIIVWKIEYIPWSGIGWTCGTSTDRLGILDARKVDEQTKILIVRLAWSELKVFRWNYRGRRIWDVFIGDIAGESIRSAEGT